MTGKIVFFDRLRGEGMVRSEQGTHFVYACNLPGRKTWYEHTACVYLEQDDEIEFELKDGFVVDVEGPVKFDAEKWNSLDQERLAFRVDDDGELISGLFASREPKEKS